MCSLLEPCAPPVTLGWARRQYQSVLGADSYFPYPSRLASSWRGVPQLRMRWGHVLAVTLGAGTQKKIGSLLPGAARSVAAWMQLGKHTVRIGSRELAVPGLVMVCGGVLVGRKALPVQVERLYDFVGALFLGSFNVRLSKWSKSISLTGMEPLGTCQRKRSESIETSGGEVVVVAVCRNGQNQQTQSWG